MIKRILKIIATVAAATLLCATAQADVFMHFFEENGNVVIHTSGEITSTPFSAGSRRQELTPAVNLTPSNGLIILLTPEITFYNIWEIDPVRPFGNGNYHSNGIFTGTPFMLSSTSFLVREGDSAFETIITFSGTTLAEMGIDLGMSTYVITGTDGTDTLTIHIGAIPEPSTYALIAGGTALAGVWIVRRRRKA